MGKSVLRCAVALALAAGAAGAGYQYAGEWPTATWCEGLDINAVNGDVYVLVVYDVTYFTPDGSLLGSWDSGMPLCMPYAVACSPAGNVYVSNVCPVDLDYIRYFTPAGSFLGQFVHTSWREVYGMDFAADGTLYATDEINEMVWHCAPVGKLLDGWEGDFLAPKGVAVAPNGAVYVADNGNNTMKYYTARGAYLGSWGGYGTGDGQFIQPWAVAVAADGTVFVVDRNNNRIQYFTAGGSFLGKFGSPGAGPGQLDRPTDVAVSLSGNRVYVSDTNNFRIQYFDATNVNVQPASLGKIRALFR